MLVFRFNEQGEYIEPVELKPDEKGKYKIPFDCTEKELPQPNWNPIFNGTDWVDMADVKAMELNNAKRMKNNELNQSCNQAILAGFEHELNGVTYWFSYDMEAQGNFRDAKEALRDGLANILPWTVREGGVDGPYTRVDIDYPTMQELALVIMLHKTEKISRYRDELMPIVEAATEVKEVEAVTWE